MKPQKIISVIILLGAISVMFLINDSTAQTRGEIPITTTSNEALELFKKGRELCEQLRLDEGRQYLKKAIQMDSSFAMAYFLLAFTQYDFDNLLNYLNKAVSLVGNVSEGEKLFLLAYKEIFISRDDIKGEELLKKLVSLYPNDKRVHREMGFLFYRTREFNTAIKHYNKSIRIDPDFAEPYNMIGYCHSHLGNYAEAEKALKKYAELLPDAANPHDSYGEILMKQGKFDESIKEYKKALSIDPNFDVSYIGLGTNLIFKGKPNEGRKQFQKLYDMASSDGQRAMALGAKADAYIYESDFEKALKELKKSYLLYEKNNNLIDMSDDISRIGDIYLEIGEFEKAKDNYIKSFELFNKSEIASDEQKLRAKRGLLYDEVRVAIKQDDLILAKNKTEQYREQIKASNNKNELRAYHRLAGLIALSDKKYEKALKEFVQANQRNPRNLCRIAEAYEGLNNKEKAKEFWGKAANFNKRSTNYAFVRSRAMKKLSEFK